MGTIELLDKILFDFTVNVLVLINKVDICLKSAWEIFRKQNSIWSEDNDDEDQNEIHEIII